MLINEQQKQALRERYSPKPTPSCHICGSEMTVQRMSASRITYGCTGAVYDDKGCHYSEGRSIADNHYEQSRVTVVDFSDPEVLALLNELEVIESKYRGLAAENGQMLRLLTNISENHDEYVNQDEYLYAGIPMDYISEINSYVSRDVDADNPFKETDAYLIEVRASGADAVANQHQRKFDELLPINVFCANEHRTAKGFAEFVATQLRKGATL
ncbi:ead/Ea22-like family protein [Citrobacter portucalensis]|uniref:ead/Ea22-like family protein n=1 Tax=Citrobacter portucalensis TaxID=1639133 RepID=UPI003B9802B5